MSEGGNRQAAVPLPAGGGGMWVGLGARSKQRRGTTVAAGQKGKRERRARARQVGALVAGGRGAGGACTPVFVCVCWRGPMVALEKGHGRYSSRAAGVRFTGGLPRSVGDAWRVGGGAGLFAAPVQQPVKCVHAHLPFALPKRQAQYTEARRWTGASHDDERQFRGHVHMDAGCFSWL